MRSSIGTPTASNSSGSQPEPSPSVSRPPASTSSVAACLASTTGLRIGAAITAVPSRSVGEAAATKASQVSGSATG